MNSSQEEQRAVQSIRDILDSFGPEERYRILEQVFAGWQQDGFDSMPGNNIMEILFIIMRESIKETNENKKYFLMKLGMYKKIAQALAEYLQDLHDASQELQADE
jgi:hypothetical protein